MCRSSRRPALLATDLVDYLVKKDVPFRQAHHIVGELVALSEKYALPLNQLPYDAVAQVHPSLEDDWDNVFNLFNAMTGRERVGMPGQKQVAARIESWQAFCRCDSD